MKRIRAIILIVVLVVGFGLGINFIIHKYSQVYSIDESFKEQVQADVPNYVTMENIPKNLKDAVVLVEDRRFYNHGGYDLISITRALFANIKNGQIVQGGSTITQQLVKNTVLSSEKTFSRKFKEMLLAVALERQYDKQQILEMYLNVIYFGSGAHGIYQASRTYFNKDVEQLTLEECAMLAGIIQAPSVYNPNENYQKAKSRQQIILDLMVGQIELK
ncbi:MAG: transglycosylase domain-containing protein [Clostridia bacterium]|nr:transglycosylase domain-containing protein [Clostridia bacterium]